jgi:SAM-dependent methyltransferase
VKYQALAPFYDRLMCHVEYDEWVALIERIVKKYYPNNKPSILEIGGGTGILGEKLKELKFNYFGSDLSFSMSKEAINKKLLFLCADARNLPVKSIFDMIIFLYDGINYFQTLDDYTDLFSEVHRCLPENGLFLFDITTETNSLRHFTNYYDFEDFEDGSFIRHSFYDQNKSIQYNKFTIYSKTDDRSSLFKRTKELHVQKIFPPTLLAEQIPESLFNIIGIWDNFSFKKFTQRSERIHFLLQKKSV